MWRSGASAFPRDAGESKSLLNGATARRGCQARATSAPVPREGRSSESGCLRVQPKVGGKLHLRLNTATRPIANKYREGKLKRTLKREFKST